MRQAAELVPPDVPVTTFVDRGHAAARIAHHAEVFGCDLIVMGSRGRGRTTAALFGSTSQGVLHATCVPVLVLRTRADASVARARLSRAGPLAAQWQIRPRGCTGIDWHDTDSRGAPQGTPGGRIQHRLPLISHQGRLP